MELLDTEASDPESLDNLEALPEEDTFVPGGLWNTGHRERLPPPAPAKPGCYYWMPTGCPRQEQLCITRPRCLPTTKGSPGRVFGGQTCGSGTPRAKKEWP